MVSCLHRAPEAESHTSYVIKSLRYNNTFTGGKPHNTGMYMTAEADINWTLAYSRNYTGKFLQAAPMHNQLAVSQHTRLRQRTG